MLTKQHKQLIRLWLKKLHEQNTNIAPRAAQNQMIADIARCITGEQNKQQRIMVAESGTGTGKSLAYLLATIPIALKMRKSVVISTATVALQQQLIEIELPRLHRASEGAFRFTLAKGRNRYCCRHKINRLITTLPIALKTHLGLLQQLSLGLSSQRWQGDRDSWPSPIPDKLWSQIQADAYSCSPQLPRHRSCPLNRARSHIKSCQIIVVNHSLLLAELDAGGGHLLPEPEDCIYILDEAHRLPEIARDQSACHLDLAYLPQQLSQCSSLLKEVETRVRHSSIINTALTVHDAIAEINTMQKQLTEFAGEHIQDFSDDRLRFPLQQLPKQLSDLAHNSLGTARRLQRGLEQMANMLKESADEGQLHSAFAEKCLSQLFRVIQMTEQLTDTLYYYSQGSEKIAQAYWIEKQGKSFTYCSSPLEVGGKLYSMLFEPAFSVIALSATLRALGRFDHYLHETGLQGRLPGSQLFCFPSPFDYDQIQLALPDHFDEPDSPEFPQQVAHYITTHTPPHSATLVLCNSYVQVEQLKLALQPYQLSEVRCQGDQSNQQLLSEHKEAIKSGKQALLIATMGFSEGIDLPGDYLTHLIIPRLPFSVPTDPVHQTHSELLTLRGQNPFMQLTLPQASRKLIQCCGRVMRKESDSGVISILDPRMKTRRYGKQLLAALPPYRKTE